MSSLSYRGFEFPGNTLALRFALQQANTLAGSRCQSLGEDGFLHTYSSL